MRADTWRVSRCSPTQRTTSNSSRHESIVDTSSVGWLRQVSLSGTDVSKRFYFVLGRQQALNSLCNMVVKPERFVDRDCKGLYLPHDEVNEIKIWRKKPSLRALSERTVETLRQRSGAFTELFAIRNLGDELAGTARASGHVTDPAVTAQRVALGRDYLRSRGLVFVVTDALLAEATLSEDARREIDALPGGGDVMAYAQGYSRMLILRFIEGIAGAEEAPDEYSDDEAAVDDDEARVEELE